MFNYQILPNDFLVNPAGNNSSDDDSSDDDDSSSTSSIANIVPAQINSSDDDGTDDDNGDGSDDTDDDDDDDARQIGLQPCDNDDYLTHLTQEAREMLEAEFRYEPGSDNQGQ